MSGPDIVTRGFMFNKEPDCLNDEMRRVVVEAIERAGRNGARDWASVKTSIKGDLSGFINRKVKRNPMILPVFGEM